MYILYIFIGRDTGFALWVNVAQLDIEIQPHYKGRAHYEGLWVENHENKMQQLT